MSRRLFPTLADYVIVAINPALVMTLVGSLIYFLLELLYQGNYPERLHFSLTMFVFAIVLVSRIAMEEGFEHAAPFGAALALVVWLAMQRFVDYGHGALAHFGWLMNGGLMALSWWCAHKLTWDSTVIDESEETEGQGLLETVGIDRASGEVRTIEQNAEQGAAKSSTAASKAAGDEKGTKQRKGKRFRWEDLLNRKDRPHAPGVWVVYFSLAALPIFGVGQAFIPAVNTASRRYAFLLFVVYVASGLGLLLTTSFLALRRYLRQRHLEMPTRMVGTWLTTGVVMIVALLALVALLPRPNAEFAVSQIPWPESKDDEEPEEKADETQPPPDVDQPKSSPVSLGQEGTRDKEATTGGGADHSPDDRSDKSDQNSQGGEGPQPGGQAEASGQQEARSSAKEDSTTKKGDQNSAGGKSGDENKQSGGEGKDSSNEKGGGSADKQADGAGDQKSQSKGDSKGEQSKDSKAESKSPSGAKSEKKDGAKPNKADAKSKQPSGGSKSGSQPEKSQRSASSPPPAPAQNPLSLSFLGDLLKWIFYVALLVGGAYLAWAHWEHVRAFLQHWLDELRQFWDQLLGRSRKPVGGGPAEPVVFVPPPRTFSEFSDPFAMGKPRGWSNADLVKYTFAALEAWSHDHGYDRRPEETPHEFARQVGAQTPPLSAGARALVEEYSRIVYGPGVSPQFNPEQLRRFWQTLRSLPAQSISTAAQV